MEDVITLFGTRSK
ncbi:hypothetical protein LINPERPRIM_LOCUS6706 [Linum perenne]